MEELVSLIRELMFLGVSPGEIRKKIDEIYAEGGVKS